MKKTKKMLALTLAVSMVMGSSFAAFAEDNPATPGGNGSTTAEGNVEGHVDKEVLKVVLPTVAADSSAFEYTMDPERLIQGTEAKKYADGTTFPATDSDTGVYFLTAPNTYENNSKPYQVINKSSCNIELTVKAKATQNTANDIALATSDTVSTTTPELYLGLIVGKMGTSTVTALSSTEATINKVIAGTPTNFEVGVKTNADGTKSYTYKEKASATTWKAVNIRMTGKVSDKVAITKDTTAPTVEVTWSWAKAADSATAATDAFDVTITPPAITLTSAGLVTVTGLTAEQNFESVKILVGDKEWDMDDEVATWNTDNWDSENGGSFTVQMSDAWIAFINDNGGKAKAIINYTDGSAESSEVTFTP